MLDEINRIKVRSQGAGYSNVGRFPWWHKRWGGRKDLLQRKRENRAKMSENHPGDCVNRGPPGEKWRRWQRKDRNVCQKVWFPPSLEVKIRDKSTDWMGSVIPIRSVSARSHSPPSASFTSHCLSRGCENTVTLLSKWNSQKQTQNIFRAFFSCFFFYWVIWREIAENVWEKNKMSYP